MRRLGFALFLASISALTVRTAHAEVFHDAEVLEPGKFSVGVEGQGEFDPGTRGQVFGHGGVGLFNGGEIDLKVGLLNCDYNYFGGEFRFGLLPNGDGYPALMAYAGGHWIDRFRHNKDFGGVHGGLEVSETIQEVSVYGAYDVSLDFVPELSRAVFLQHAVLGARIPVSEHLSFLIEGGYGIHNRDFPNRDYVGGGATLYF